MEVSIMNCFSINIAVRIGKIWRPVKLFTTSGSSIQEKGYLDEVLNSTLTYLHANVNYIK